MTYIGVSPSNGVRRVHTYTATGSQTTFTGASSEGITLSYTDANFMDVYQNGVLLAPADYTATSGTSVVLAEGAAASDIVTITVYDAFSVADTVSKSAGGTFDGNIAMAGTLGVTGVLTGTSLDISGDIDVDGTTNLDVVDIDGTLNVTSDVTFTGDLELISTDATNTDGPIVKLTRNSASPAVNDILGSVRFLGKNDADQDVTYAEIDGIIFDETDGTENGALRVTVPNNGAQTTYLTLGDGRTRFQQDARFDDNVKANFGTGNDLKIYHDGSKSVISDEGTGVLWIAGDSEVSIGNPAVTEYYIRAFKDGAVQLMHDNSTKFATSSGGVTVTGNATISGELQVDTNTLKVQASDNRVGIGTGSPNYARLNIASTAAGAQERGLYIELTPDSGTSPNNVAVFSATNSNMTQPLVRIHHESPTADQLMLQCTTTGSNTVKFSVDEDGDVYTAGGINVGGTGTANKLDDYEEGTFTPAWSASGSTFQYSVQQGNYTKIGHRVVFTIYVQLDGGGNSFSGNNVTLGGLPFTSGEAMIYPVIGRFLDASGSGYTDPAVLLSSGGTTMALRQYGDNVAGIATPANNLSSSSGQVWISGSYKV